MLYILQPSSLWKITVSSTISRFFTKSNSLSRGINSADIFACSSSSTVPFYSLCKTSNLHNTQFSILFIIKSAPFLNQNFLTLLHPSLWAKVSDLQKADLIANLL